MHYQNERNYGCRVSDAWSFRGLKTAVLENELLRVVILVDKGADIYQLVHKPTDVDFLWRSPTGVRDPRRFLPTTGDPVGVWMDAYEGGWQTVFPAGGFPAQYRDADLGLHAEANLMPWDCAVMEDTPDRASIRFWVRTARAPFFFQKTLSLTSGSGVLEVDQTLTNEGGEAVHCVWGEPHRTRPSVPQRRLPARPAGRDYRQPSDGVPSEHAARPRPQDPVAVDQGRRRL